MQARIPWKVITVVTVIIIASLGGGFWAGSLYHGSKQISQYKNQIDQLMTDIGELQDQIGSLRNTISDLSSENKELIAELRRLGPSSLDTGEIDLSDVEMDLLNFARYYSPEPLETSLRVLQYQLPLKASEISNFQSFSSKIRLSDAALGLLERNGFVVIDNPFDPEEEYITQPYEDLKMEQIPVFITTDSLLHLYHIQFDETLRQIEEREFFEDIWDMSKSLLDNSIEKYNRSTGDLNEASRRNAAYFAVALSLLQPKEGQVCKDEDILDDPGCFKAEDLARYSFEVPDFVEAVVEQELGLIEGHYSVSRSPIFVYKEDYTQYVPRGHYTRSEKLRNYFKALMWYGRMSLLLKGSDIIGEGETCDTFPPCNALVSAYDAKIQTMQACLIASRLVESPELRALWDRIYVVTSFYVGFSDDLGPYEYIEAMDSVFGGVFDPNRLTDESIELLKAKLAEYRPPEIYGGTGWVVLAPPFTPEQADEILEATKGFRLMGQRFVPDSYVFQNLVPPKVMWPLGPERPFTWVMTPAGPARGFPRGLDVMAILGSERAVELLDELKDSNYVNYSAQFNLLKEEFDILGEEDWNKNLYWSWLYALKPLLGEFGEGYPTFMQTQAWRDKELTTALASWAELRHDTILYAKQSYTATLGLAPLKPSIVGYVEPVPEFYARLLSLTRMTKEGLDELEVLDKTAEMRLSSLEEILRRLVELSEKELGNEELTQEDYDFIRDFGDELEDVIAGVDDKTKKTTLVADVHTDQNTMQVLEEGVGYVRLMVVAYKVPDGRVLVGAGPVMSYYEFKHPIADRLTDEAWRELLESDPPDDPEWVLNFTK
jgi:hypothetical protein